MKGSIFHYSSLLSEVETTKKYKFHLQNLNKINSRRYSTMCKSTSMQLGSVRARR